MSVKRYELTDNGVEVFSDGRYVLHSDYAALLARHNALVEAVKWERECEGFDPFFHSSFTAPSWLSRHAESHRTKQAARAEVGRLIGEVMCAD